LTRPETSMTAASGPINVAFIGGYTRSGSTLLDRLLGELPGVQSVGELRHIWGMGFVENRLCGCGASFRDCRFWRAVVARAFGEMDIATAERRRDAEERLYRARYTPFLLRPSRLPAAQRDARAAFLESRARLFAAIAFVSGASTIVDSSKNPSYGLLLGATPGLAVCTLHLVRDSRATSYSWTRQKPDRRHHGRTDFFPRRPPLISGTWWAANNTLMELTERLGRMPHLRVRYEDLVAKPSTTIARIAQFAGIVDDPSPPLPQRRERGPAGEGSATLGVHHSIGGNPMRFEQGDIPLRADTEWQKAMSLPAKAIVTAVTWPLLVAYGYLGRRR